MSRKYTKTDLSTQLGITPKAMEDWIETKKTLHPYLSADALKKNYKSFNESDRKVLCTVAWFKQKKGTKRINWEELGSLLEQGVRKEFVYVPKTNNRPATSIVLKQLSDAQQKVAVLEAEKETLKQELERRDNALIMLGQKSNR